MPSKTRSSVVAHTAPKIGLSGQVEEREPGQTRVREVALAAKYRLRPFKTRQNEPLLFFPSQAEWERPDNDIFPLPGRHRFYS